MNSKLNIAEKAKEAVDSLLPEKSKKRYEDEYNKFVNWCNANDVNDYKSETVMLAYFKVKSELCQVSTLWTIFSMLKSVLLIKHNIDMAQFKKLIAFLKRLKDSYKPKKSEILNEAQIDKFINTAPDDKYLMIKVALIIGISGACRKGELTFLDIKNIKMGEEMIIITLKNTKTKCDRSFVINDKPWIKLIQIYKNLRPPNTLHNRFFIYYANNKCSRQPVGANTFGNMARKIAEFLKLPNAQNYTGHCFRRSSATLLANKGADLLSVKRHGGWKSSTVAEGYIEDSITSKISVADLLAAGPSGNSGPSTATEPTRSIVVNSESLSTESTLNTNQVYNLPRSAGITLNNCSNFTINLNK